MSYTNKAIFFLALFLALAMLAETENVCENKAKSLFGRRGRGKPNKATPTTTSTGTSPGTSTETTTGTYAGTSNIKGIFAHYMVESDSL